MTVLASRRRHLPIILIASALVAGSAFSQQDGISRAFASAVPAAAPSPWPWPGTTTIAPGPLANTVGLRAGPTPAPLELRLPSLGTRSAVISVGLTPNNVMDAPTGPANDPVWRQAFWYRGSALPGTGSTTVLAGHVDDPLGRPAVFAHIDHLKPDDSIIVRNTQSGSDVRFVVTELKTYPLEQTSDPAILTGIYGVGPVAGTSPQPSADGRSHLTLITCAGTFKNGTRNHRLVVFATQLD